MAATQVDLDQFIGRAWERLDLAERELLCGSYIAREVYTPKTLPLQRIEAIGTSIPSKPAWPSCNSAISTRSTSSSFVSTRPTSTPQA